MSDCRLFVWTLGHLSYALKVNTCEAFESLMVDLLHFHLGFILKQRSGWTGVAGVWCLAENDLVFRRRESFLNQPKHATFYVCLFLFCIQATILSTCEISKFSKCRNVQYYSVHYTREYVFISLVISQNQVCKGFESFFILNSQVIR